MTAREFIAKHYGSLSAGVFGVGLLAVLATYGGGFSAEGVSQPDPAAQQAQQAAAPVPASEAVPADGEETAAASDETSEEPEDPLEAAMAAEEAKAQERREAIREEINKEREAAGLPLLPAVASEDSGE